MDKNMASLESLPILPTNNFIPQNDGVAFVNYCKTHSITDIFNFLIGLQLSPNNHGKNVRIEILLRLAILNIHPGGKPVVQKELVEILDSDFAHNSMEDLPCNLFSENVMYYGGAYTVFPGISSQAIEILTNLLYAVLKDKNGKPDTLEAEMHYGTLAMLLLGDYIARKANIQGNVQGVVEEETRFVYDNCGKDYSLSVDETAKLFLQNKIPPSILESFILDVNNTSLASVDPDASPLLVRPIVRFEDRYYFLLISNEANAISSFIERSALQYHYEDELVAKCHSREWDQIQSSCPLMGWTHLKDVLPKSNDSHFGDAVCQFDRNWFAYLCFAHDNGDELHNVLTNEVVQFPIDEHIEANIKHLKSVLGKDAHFLSVLFYSSMGEHLMLFHDGAKEEDYRLDFCASDYIILYKSEHWNPLSLLHFAQTLRNYGPAPQPGQNILDLYSIYKKYGESFYMSDDQKPDFLIIPPDDGKHLIFSAKMRRNLHSEEYGRYGAGSYMPVVSVFDYAPIFKPAIESKKLCLTVSAYSVPIWFHCDQIPNKLSEGYDLAYTFAMAIAFWLYKLSPGLRKYVDSEYRYPVFVDLQFDSQVLEQQYTCNVSDDDNTDAFSFNKQDNGIAIQIHRPILSIMRGPDNSGERILMRNLVAHLTKADATVLDAVIDEYMPLGQAKMILMPDTEDNEILDNRNLLPPLYISQSSDQMLLDDIPGIMASRGKDFQGKIENIDESLKFLNSLVSVLIGILVSQVGKYNKVFMLMTLVENHESLLQERENDSILVPAQMLCFGESDEYRSNCLTKEKELTDSSLATRCLIELIVSQSGMGGKDIPNISDIEHMLALMRSIVTYGAQSNSLKFGLAEIYPEKLGSGRYCISDDSFQDGMEKFATANNEESMRKQIVSFPKRLSIGRNLSMIENHPHQKLSITSKDVNAALVADWGVSYSEIDAFCYGCYLIGYAENRSHRDMLKSDFISEIAKSQSSLTSETIEKCIFHFSLGHRESYLTAPTGYHNFEVYPWEYNREFSFIRRFILLYEAPNGTQRLIFGPRSAMVSLRQLTQLISEGRLKDDTPKLKELMGRFNELKGRLFNDEIRAFLKECGDLKVWDYEVKIAPRGHFNAEKNYGDIDVLAYDEHNRILYSIECKDTEKARNIREMKAELDKYFGRIGEKKKGYIQKHLDRHKWLSEHQGQVKQFIEAKDDIKIVSFLLTSEVIPLAYISKVKSPLPILNYNDLKIKGTSEIFRLSQ